jgi:clan AA aspartic protease
MTGHVDSYGRALIAISIRPPTGLPPDAVEAWIDTGFNGDLVLPQGRIDDLALMPSGTLKAILADGSEVPLQRYTCLVEWFGEDRELEVVANDGEYPLLGVGLLIGRDLRINYRAGAVTID